MKIVADRDIFGVEEAFSPLGDLLLLPGRAISAADVRDADALLVRTVTKIDTALVADSSLTFVGSATSGTDHVDSACLAEAGIGFCHAPGCNADAVVNYVFAALAWLARHQDTEWRNRSAGIVGAGNVGGRLARTMIALGMDVAIYDPFLPRSHPLASSLASLETVLSRAIVSLHVPLTRSGAFPTFHMLDGEMLGRLAPDAILVNAARGEVVDNVALEGLLASRPRQRVVLDTWENEPGISATLLDKVSIGTPHIAGYSLQGKRNGTAAILQGFCDAFGLAPETGSQVTAPEALPENKTGGEPAGLDEAILRAYPLDRDFLPKGQRDIAPEFDRRRNGYVFRKEFGEFSVPAGSLTPALARDLAVLGFSTA